MPQIEDERALQDLLSYIRARYRFYREQNSTGVGETSPSEAVEGAVTDAVWHYGVGDETEE